MHREDLTTERKPRRALFSPSRRATKPILSDDPVADAVAAGDIVFYTAASQRLARHMDFIIAGGSGATLLAAWLIDLQSGPVPLRNLFILLAFSIAGVPAVKEVWEKIRVLRIDVDLLMLLGAGLAAYIGSPFEGALLLFLFSLAGGMESYALRKTQSAIVALRALAPTEAILLDGTRQERVALSQVGIGARLLVRPGEKMPLDGVVDEGRSSIDESAVTGESIPRDVGPGDPVYAGTHNVDGRLVVRVTKLARDSTLAKIVELVTEARRNPASAQRLIDRIGPAYSIGVIFAALVVGAFSGMVFDISTRDSIHRGIALLIVASPCALIIATPVVYLSAIASAARRGVLIKGGAHLEVVANAKAVAFDKTGTLTTGKVKLVGIESGAGLDERGMLRLSGALSASSTHPLAMAVNDALVDRGVEAPSIEDYENKPGEGIVGRVEGRRVWIGRPEMAAQYASAEAVAWLAERAERLRHEGKTVSALVVDDCFGLLAFQDTVREGAFRCVERLRAMGIERIEMLTGDHEIVASRVSSQLTLDGYRAGLAPHEKVEATESLQASYGTLVLVGDGINDAPALVRADVGVAMGAMGADVALDAADIVLMQDKIESVAWLHRHALRTVSIVRQNLTVALTVIGILSVFAVVGGIPLPLAVIGHEGSTVAVALNALRLLRTEKL